MLTALISFALVTQEAPKIKARSHIAAVKNDKRPVTEAEAATVFEETRRIFGKVLNANLAGTTIKRGSAPATREEIAIEMAGILDALDSKMKFVPRPAKLVKSMIRIQPLARKPLERLIVGGYVGPYSVLATSSTDNMSINQFGTALGFFISRTVEVTHMPSTKWTPILMKD